MYFSACSIFIFSFFFFKQKTAYEMRISDWSSDVCSSDLHLKINGDFQYVDATAENRSFTAFPQRDGGTLSIDLSGKLQQIQSGTAGVDDQANYYIIALLDHLEDSTSLDSAGLHDLEWDVAEHRSRVVKGTRGALRGILAG